MIRLLTLALLLLTSAAYAGQGMGPGPGFRTYGSSADTGVSGWTLTDSGNYTGADLDSYENAYTAGGNPLEYYLTTPTGIADYQLGDFWVQMSKDINIKSGGVISAKLQTFSNNPSAFSGTLIISNTDGSSPVTVFTWSSANSGVTQTVSSNAYAGNKKVTVRATFNGVGGDADAHIESISIPL